MAQTISQGLALPANVVSGGTIQSAEIVTLYNTLNAFSIPDSVASLIQSAYSTDTAQSVTGPSTSTSASAIDVTISAAATKVIIGMTSFQWQHSATASSTAFALSVRKNGTEFARTPMISTSTQGNGLLFFIVGPHDATYTTPAVGLVNGGATSTGSLLMFSSTAALANAAWTSVGFQVQGTTSTSTAVHVINFGYTRIWKQT